jgi:hypothetical protein
MCKLKQKGAAGAQKDDRLSIDPPRQRVRAKYACHRSGRCRAHHTELALKIFIVDRRNYHDGLLPERAAPQLPTRQAAPRQARLFGTIGASSLHSTFRARKLLGAPRSAFSSALPPQLAGFASNATVDGNSLWDSSKRRAENSASDQNRMPVTPFCEGALSSELKQPEIVP